MQAVIIGEHGFHFRLGDHLARVRQRLVQKLRQTVFSLWHFPWGCPRFPLRTILSCGARTFLPSAKRTGDHLSFFDQIYNKSLFFRIYVQNPVTMGASLNFMHL